MRAGGGELRMKHELQEMIALGERMIASEVPGILATLFAARGSTYRPLGSMMVGLPGTYAGGVSGGCLEAYVVREGVLATQSQPAAILSFSTAHETPVGASALGCGGSIEILVERLWPGHLVWLKELSAANAADAPSVLQCLVESSGGALDVRRQWLNASGRTTNMPHDLEVICRRVLREGKTCHVPLGTNRRTLVQYVPPTSRLVIVGAGHDARPVCDLGKLLGWHVTVVDRRAHLATAARFPNADVVSAGEWDEILAGVPITSRTAVLLMTHSLEDDACVLALLRAQPGYVGALGPAHRREWLLEEAAANSAGLSESLIAQVRGPMGLDLGDRSPEGIALSVTAEILAWANGRDAQPLCSKIPIGNAVNSRRMCHA
jgi:xanthine/CO dehydrogenase XdhC/CoxF family maturation factor